MIGKVIGEKYVLLEKIGQGGNGRVYKARDLRLGKQWAVKQLGAGKFREAEVLKSLEHSMIPRVVDCLEEEGDIWLVMDYIPGKNLMELCREGRLTGSALLGWAIDLCQVLAYLHGLNPPYIHGDLKPENLVVSQEGKLFLVDFGAGAKRQGGVCEGTPGFAAPEQARGIVTGCSDIYAFGKTWGLLLGSRAGAGWKKIIEKCCRPSPKKRYQQIREVEKLLIKMKKNRENRWLFLFLAGALSVCAAAGYTTGNEKIDREWELPAQESISSGRQMEVAGEDEKERWKELGRLAKELSQAAGISRESARQRGIHEAAEQMGNFYREERQQNRKQRAGLLLAWAYREENCLSQAESLYRELLLFYPDSAECYGSYGCMLLKQGADQKYLESLYEAGEQAVSDKEEYHYRIWARRMEKGRE